MKRNALLAAFLALSAVTARAQSTATLMGIDVYRSGTLTAQKVEEEAGSLIRSYVGLKNVGRNSLNRRADILRADIEKRVAKLGDFASVRMSYSEYYTSAQHTAYVTLDVVDSQDASARLPFKPWPEGRVEDPESLLAAWRRYSDLGGTLLKKGLIPTERPDCAALYCLWGSPTPELAAFETRFAQAAGPAKRFLLDVLEKDSDPAKRVAAVFLLGYLPAGREVLNIMLEALHDPDETVRAAVLRVLADVAVYHKDIYLDVKKIIPVIDFPAVSDRAKALGILVEMTEDPVNRPYIMQGALPRLLGLLKLAQPSNHDMAFTLLGQLSSESYDRRDYGSWAGWIADPKGAAKKKKR